MSWFSEIAGKAENFLNKVDQEAASALQKNLKPQQIPVNSFDQNTSVISDPVVVKENPHSVNHTRTLSYNGSVNNTSNQHPTIAPKKLSKSKSTSKLNASNKQDDEKLLEFLNSSDDRPTVKSQKQSTLHVQTGAGNKSDEREAMSSSQNKSSVNRGSDLVGSSPAAVLEMEKTVTVANVIQSEEDKLKASISQHVETKSENTNKLDADNMTETKNDQSSALALENKLLKKEMVSLNQEVSSALKRAKDFEENMMKYKMKFETQSSQMSSSDKLLRELQSRDADLTEALAAKDSQIAVLRIRIQEVDQDLQGKQRMLESIRAQNDRLLKDHTDSSGLQSQALDSMKQKLSDAESALQLEKDALRTSQREAADRLQQLEEEQRRLVTLVTETERKLVEEKNKNTDLLKQMKTFQTSLEQTREELMEYKHKAQKILQSKEKLILNLKEAGSSDAVGISDVSASLIELESLRHERDTMRDELNQATMKISNLQADLQDMESSMQNEIDQVQRQVRSYEEQIQSDVQIRKDLESENLQLKNELRYVREDLTKNKAMLQSRITDRDVEIEKLRKQVTAKSMNNSTEVELESRLRTLTENLIQKQTLVETLSTEKNSLVLQLERIEKEMKESRTYARPSHSVVGINEADEVKAKVPVFLRESPFDGNITRKVKRAYNSLDTFSIRLGVFLRRFPVVRVFILIYVMLLHLWVLIVLTTYTPEMHSSGYNPPAPKLPVKELPNN